jgi:hypothetical protein
MVAYMNKVRTRIDEERALARQTLDASSLEVTALHHRSRSSDNNTTTMHIAACM